MGGRGNSGTIRATTFSLTGGENDPEITDAIEDYYLPNSVRQKLSDIRKIKTYSDFEKYLKTKGIKLETDLQSLKERKQEEIPAVRDLQQKIITAIETYESSFGKDSLSALKSIKLYDKNLDVPAAYHFNLKGEKDPLAGTIRFRDWNASGRDVYHELAHAVQDSVKPKGSDIISYTNNLSKNVNIPKTSYTGTSGLGEENAEKMAESLAFGFSRGSKSGQKFINDFRKYRRKR